MKRRLSVGLSIAMLATLAVSGAATAASPFQNGSFENPGSTAIGAYGTYGAGSTAITGWTVGIGTIDWVGTLWTAADGARSIDLNGFSAGSIFQDLDTTTGHTYRVTFALSGNPDGGVKTLVAFTDASTATFPFSYDTGAKHNTTTNMMWDQTSFTFVAKAALTRLTFLSTTSSTPTAGPAIDNVSVTDITKAEGAGAGKGGPGAQCKNGGWKSMLNQAGHHFRNQGQCVSYFATRMRHGGAGPK